MIDDETIEAKVYELIASVFQVDKAGLTRDFIIGGGAVRPKRFDLSHILTGPGLANLLEFNIALQDEFPVVPLVDLTNKRRAKALQRRLVRGQANAGELIDWLVEHKQGLDDNS